MGHLVLLEVSQKGTTDTLDRKNGDTIWLCHEKSLINGGFNEKIIYKWAIFHGYVN
jgi:hypothetical protein